MKSWEWKSRAHRNPRPHGEPPELVEGRTMGSAHSTCPHRKCGPGGCLGRQLTCKPGSVRPTSLPARGRRTARRGGHSSGTPVASRLMQPTRATGLGKAGFPRVAPIWSCSRWGLPCRPHCWVRGALLPHPFTLACPKTGGLLSVALSLGSPPPAVSRHRLPMEPGLSSPCGYPHGAATRSTGVGLL